MKTMLFVRVKDKNNVENLKKWCKIHHVMKYLDCVLVEIDEENTVNLLKEEGVLGARKPDLGQYLPVNHLNLYDFQEKFLQKVEATWENTME